MIPSGQMAPSGSSNLLLAAVLVNAAIAVAKLVTAAMTGSGAVLAEFIHSIALTTSLALVLIALWRTAGATDGRRAQDAESELHFWCLVVPILIYSLAAGVALNESMAWLLAPRRLAELPAGLAILAVSLAVQAALALIIQRHARLAAGVGSAPFQLLTVASMAAVAGVSATLAGLAATHVFGTIESDALAALTVGLILGGVAAMMGAATRKLLRSVHNKASIAAPAASAEEPRTISLPENAASQESVSTPPRKNHPPPKHGKRKRR